MSTFTSGLYTQSTNELQAELVSGEALLWAGQPSRKVVFHARDAFTIPFSLLWGGFAIFWELGVTGFLSTPKGGPSLFMALWGIPFVLMGQYMIWGRFLYTAWRKGYTHYGITNRRILILNTAPSRRLTDRSLRNLDTLSLLARNDGVGTIEFRSDTENPAMWGSWGWRRSGRYNQIDIDLSDTVFYDIADARPVYRLLQEQREKAQTPTT